MKKILVSIASLSLAIWLVACSATSESTSADAVIAVTVPKISVQLWSVKDQVKADIDDTLEQLAKMGFQGVEFANEFGPYKKDPKALKVKLTSLGLQGSGAHVSFEQLNEKNFSDTVSFYKALDVTSLIVPWDERAWSVENIDAIVGDLNALSEKLAAHGMQVGYHNHQHEFNDYRKSTFWDYMAINTKSNVIMQQDVGWTTYAGKDPAEYVYRYPGRTLTTHYKVKLPEGTEGKLPIIGKDTIDWTALIKANMEAGGTKWIVVEQEEYPNGMTPLEAVEASMQGLQSYLND